MRTLTCVMSVLLCLGSTSCGDKEEPAKTTSRNQTKPKKLFPHRSSVHQDAPAQEAFVLETKVTVRAKEQ